MKPYAAMVLLQFGYASTSVAAAATLKQGMNHFVLVVYRNAVAVAVLAPFAFCFERYIFRMEKLNLRKRHSQAKVAGAAETVAGAILMIVYKGPVVNFLWSVYVGIVCSGVSYYVQGMVMKMRGPSVCNRFQPSLHDHASFMGHIILSEEITLGR
ncbi:WAT1-related protein [Platanthera guangdongensis]|uniref:WAT1-related protein n=1 Tax=Platanthera guangdongensis TaxID=2320717 RepID=A0ABR2MRA0_9ASPA